MAEYIFSKTLFRLLPYYRDMLLVLHPDCLAHITPLK